MIDDSLTTRMLEQSILESAGYEVDVASSGEDALERARLRRYAPCPVRCGDARHGRLHVHRARPRDDPALRDIPAMLGELRALAGGSPPRALTSARGLYRQG